MSPLHIAYAILVAALWGANFVAARAGIAEVPPFLLTAVRFAVTALILVPFFPRPDRGKLKQIALLSLTLGVLHFSMLFAALEKGLDIASCAVVAQLGVPFSCLLGAVFFKDTIGFWRMLGLVVSFAGIFVIAGNPNVLAHPLGFGIALFGAFFWGVANIQIKRMGEVGIFSFLGWMALFAVPLLLMVSLAVEGNPLPYLQQASWRVPLALTYTVLGSTLGGYGLWYFLIRQYPLSQVAPYSLLSPLFSILAAYIFYGEGLTWQVTAGGLLTIAGVAVIVVRRPKLAAFGDAV